MLPFLQAVVNAYLTAIICRFWLESWVQSLPCRTARDRIQYDMHQKPLLKLSICRTLLLTVE